MGGEKFYAASTGNANASCPNITPQCPNSCDVFGYKYEGWAHYSVAFGPESTTPSLYEFVSDPTGVFNWFDNKELWYQRYASAASPGAWSCHNSDGWTQTPWLNGEGVPRGVLGRNLRYNLFEFNTGTVFYNEDKTPTMMTSGFGGKQHNPPIFKWTFWNSTDSAGSGGCHQQGGGVSVGDCDLCCVQDDPENGVCCGCELTILTNPCTNETTPVCGTVVTNCADGNLCTCADDHPCNTQFPPICPQYCCTTQTEGCNPLGTCNGPHCDPNNNNSGGGGLPLLDPNTPNVFEETNSEVTIRPIKSKNVSIAPGVCVNMLCPECDLYESC
jgi:hypothetical protein